MRQHRYETAQVKKDITWRCKMLVGVRTFIKLLECYNKLLGKNMKRTFCA